MSELRRWAVGWDGTQRSSQVDELGEWVLAVEAAALLKEARQATKLRERLGTQRGYRRGLKEAGVPDWQIAKLMEGTASGHHPIHKPLPESTVDANWGGLQ
jgi:hypothetical protein